MKINEIFLSIDGEVNRWGQGTPSVFIRTSGCNLNCRYCDTTYHREGVEMDIDDIVAKANSFGVGKVTITGGEPLLQREELIRLVELLRRYLYKVSIETNGTLPIPHYLQEECCIVADYKLPGSGWSDPGNIENLRPLMFGKHFIKFVVSTKSDFYVGCDVLQNLTGPGKNVFFSESKPKMATFAFSPVVGEEGGVKPKELLDWMCSAKIIRLSMMNLQIHKLVDLK